METFTLEKDIPLYCVKARAFPDGILEAHEQLHALAPFMPGRNYFGISRPENGNIVYKAAAEELSPGEAERLGCERLVLEKGKYISISIPDYMRDLPAIGRAFRELLGQPGLDPQGYCVEWYLSKRDVRCMIRLAQ